MNIKPLIFIPSARDLPEFEQATSKLHFDKLWVKYYPQEEAYTVGRDWFLAHDYTHLIILPDDLIVKQDIEILIKDYVVSGWCIHGKSPVERKGLDSNVSFSLPSIFTPPMSTVYDSYQFIPVSDIEGYIEKGMILASIRFTGFAPTVIPRKIVEQIQFRSNLGCCIDTCLSSDLLLNGITHFVDFRIKTTELEATDLNLLQVGKKERRIIHETI